MLISILTSLWIQDASAQEGLHIDAQVTSLYAEDDNWYIFSDSDSLVTYGLRATLDLSDHLAAQASYGLGRSGVQNDIGTEWYDEDSTYAGTGEGFETLYVGHRLGLGGQAFADPYSWLRTYVSVEGLMLYGVAYLDADSRIDQDPSQTKASGVSGGAVGALGLDLHKAKRRRASLRPSFQLELGYGWTSQQQLDELGSLGFKGLHASAGVGLEF